MTNRPPSGSVRHVTVTGLDVQSTGHIVVAGSLEYPPLASEPKDGRDAFLARLLDAGAFDVGFEPVLSHPSLTSEGGYLLLDRGSDGDRVLSMSVDPATDEITWLNHQLQYEHADEEALLWSISFDTPGGVVDAPATAGTRDMVLVPRFDPDPAKLYFTNYGNMPKLCSLIPPGPRTCLSLEEAFPDRGLTAALAFAVDGVGDGGYFSGVRAQGNVGIAKFDRDFEPSTTFAAGVGYVLATVTAPGSSSINRLTAVAADGQGGVFVAGHTLAPPATHTPFLLKFHHDGSGLDASFGQQGRVVGATGPLVGWPCLLVDQRGKLWSAGLDTQGPLVARWAADGTPETTRRDFAGPFTPERCAFDPAGRLLVAGGGRDGAGYAALKVVRLLDTR